MCIVFVCDREEKKESACVSVCESVYDEYMGMGPEGSKEIINEK